MSRDTKVKLEIYTWSLGSIAMTTTLHPTRKSPRENNCQYAVSRTVLIAVLDTDTSDLTEQKRYPSFGGSIERLIGGFQQKPPRSVTRDFGPDPRPDVPASRYPLRPSYLASPGRDIASVARSYNAEVSIIYSSHLMTIVQGNTGHGLRRVCAPHVFWMPVKVMDTVMVSRGRQI